MDTQSEMIKFEVFLCCCFTSDITLDMSAQHVSETDATLYFKCLCFTDLHTLNFDLGLKQKLL